MRRLFDKPLQMLRTNGHLLILLLLFSSSLYAVSRSFNPGYLSAWDNPSHLLKAQFFYQSLDLGRLGIWGWLPEWYEGCAPFIFYAPGFFIAVMGVKFLSLDILSVNDALKITLAVSYALFPVVLYWLCRTLGMTRNIALSSAVFSLTSSSVAGIGIDGIYGIGLYTHFLGILLFMVFLGLLHRAMQRNGGGRDFLLAGSAFGLLIITHSITTGYVGIAGVLYLLFRLIYRKKTSIVKFSSIYFLGLLLSLFWFAPLLSSFSLFGPDAGFYPFGLEELANRIVNERLIVSKTTAVFSGLGIIASMYVMLRRRQTSMAWAYLITLSILTTVISSTYVVKLMEAHAIDDPAYKLVQRIFSTMFQTRAAAFLGVLMPILAGHGLSSVISAVSYVSTKILCLFKSKKIRRISSGIPIVLSVVSLLVLLGSYSAEQAKLGRDQAKTIQTDYAVPYGQWADAFRFLKSNVSAGSLVKPIEMFQIILCGYMNGLNFLDTMDDQSARNLLHKTHVDYLFVAGKPEMQKDFLEKVYDDGKKIRVYLVKNITGMDYYVENITILRDAYKMTVSVKKDSPLNVSVPVQYNDHWGAIVNGKPAKVMRGPEGLVFLELAGGINSIELSFSRKPLDNAVFLISLITFTIVSVLLLIPRKKAEHFTPFLSPYAK
jgi:hypothetical protein